MIDSEFYRRLEADTNKNVKVTTEDMLYTLWVNISMFIVFMLTFEGCRHLKQVYLKRFQQRFEQVNRVPPLPPKHIIGWLVTTFQIPEIQVLQMVGLDGYVLLRYHVVCFKFACFVSFWGFLVLLPVYTSASEQEESWSRYTIANVLISESTNTRLWFAVLFAYIYSAYFCSLMHAEYNNFAARRLQYLVQVYPVSEQADPDTPPQTYFTVMVECIPPSLRSASALREFFERLFPGEVAHVEVALDLGELQSMIYKRQNTRNALEKAIAIYETTKVRPMTYAKTDNSSIPMHFFGYEKVDAIAYHTTMLKHLNASAKELQRYHLEKAQTIDGTTQKKLKNKLDTRAADLMGRLRKQGEKVSNLYKKTVQVKSIDEVLFGEDNAERSHMQKSTPVKSPFWPVQTPTTVPGKDDDNNSVSQSGGDHEISYSSNSSGYNNVNISRSSGNVVIGITSDIQVQQAVHTNSDSLSIATDTNNPMHTDIVTGSAIRNGSPGRLLKKDQGLLEAIGNRVEERMSKVLTKQNMKAAKYVAKEGLAQASVAGRGAIQGLIEMERVAEMLVLGAYYKMSSTAFVTFNSRVTKIVAYKMLLSHDQMEIKMAPNPYEIIWDNVPTPKSQIKLRHTITNIGLAVGALFWSSVGDLWLCFFVASITSVDHFASFPSLTTQQQQLLSAFILLALILMLPFGFDLLARYYEGMKIESEIQNSIMLRYFYYQVVNVYVTVACAGIEITQQISEIFQDPRVLIEIMGKRVPAVSLFFCNLVILKTFAALPLEILRPPVLLAVFSLGSILDPKKSTRRELRTGLFQEYPQLYGWVYPQLLFVLMILLTYQCIAPLLMPFGIIFFAFSYVMYKYQLLYVYVNNYQCGGDMWYSVFLRSLVSLVFAILTLLGYMSLQIEEISGPFFLLLPLPCCILYFYFYCENKFRSKTQALSLDFAKEIDHHNNERKKIGKSVPHDLFKTDTFRQPALWEPQQYPEPYRRLVRHRAESMSQADTEKGWGRRGRRGTVSINVLDIVDDTLEDEDELVEYFESVVIPLAESAPTPLPRSLINKLEKQTRDAGALSSITEMRVRASSKGSRDSPIHECLESQASGATADEKPCLIHRRSSENFATTTFGDEVMPDPFASPLDKESLTSGYDDLLASEILVAAANDGIVGGEYLLEAVEHSKSMKRFVVKNETKNSTNGFGANASPHIPFSSKTNALNAAPTGNTAAVITGASSAFKSKSIRYQSARTSQSDEEDSDEGDLF